MDEKKQILELGLEKPGLVLRSKYNKEAPKIWDMHIFLSDDLSEIVKNSSTNNLERSYLCIPLRVFENDENHYFGFFTSPKSRLKYYVNYSAIVEHLQFLEKEKFFFILQNYPMGNDGHEQRVTNIWDKNSETLNFALDNYSTFFPETSEYHNNFSIKDLYFSHNVFQK